MGLRFLSLSGVSFFIQRNDFQIIDPDRPRLMIQTDMEPDGFRFDFCPAAGPFEIFDIDDGLERMPVIGAEVKFGDGDEAAPAAA